MSILILNRIKGGRKTPNRDPDKVEVILMIIIYLWIFSIPVLYCFGVI